jgi:hypothetical protein
MGQLKRMQTGWLERTLAVLAWVARQRGQTEAVAAHLATGIDGETAAFSYLRRRGYTVAARRWSSGDVPGDIDLIAWKGTMLCFVEVKTRTRCLSGRDRHRLAQAQHVAPPGPPVRQPVDREDCPAGALRCGECLPCAG